MNHQSHFFSESDLCAKAEQALSMADRLSDAAEVSIFHLKGFSVSARMGDVETLEHFQERGLTVSVYHQQRVGSASTSDLTSASIQATVEKACSIASFAGQDPYSGLADESLLAKHYPNLDLYHHWAITPSQAIDMAVECETLAREQDSRLICGEGVSVETRNAFSVYANSHGFMGSYPSSRHSITCDLIAQAKGEMQRDYDYTTARDADLLEHHTNIAKRAAAKTLQHLGAKPIKTQTCPIIFSPQMAKGLLGHFIAAISGGNLYRQASFLLDHLGQKIFPDFMHIYQRPHIRGALGSAPFDHEGVSTQDQDYIQDGLLTRYVLGSYSSRKLGLTTTGNAGGLFNLRLDDSGLDFNALLKEMDTGLLVTDLMGQGVNITTGDYSRGAAGFWVEKGKIQYPVQEITIAGNLKDMFKGIVKVGNDVDQRGNFQTGSILVDAMTIAGL